MRSRGTTPHSRYVQTARAIRQEPVHHGILGIDIRGFGREEWTDPIRAHLRVRLRGVFDRALDQAEIDRSLAVLIDTGDGLLVLIAAAVSPLRLLHPLVTSLTAALASDNEHAPAAERMQLRVVVHAGLVLQDPYGHSGDSLNYAARLLDASAGRAILANLPTTDIVLLVSEHVYRGVVRHGYPGIDPDGYQPVWVESKETIARVWVHLPNHASQPDLAQLMQPPSSSTTDAEEQQTCDRGGWRRARVKQDHIDQGEAERLTSSDPSRSTVVGQEAR